MKQLFLIIFILLLIGCPDNKYDYDIIITDFAVNLDELNSEYDDYNMDLPYPAQRMDIYFSSNRNSLGNDFDIVAGKMDFSFHSEDDILNVSIPNDNPPWESEMIFPKINTENNEFGPFTYYSGDDMLFMYATELNDTFAINFIELTNWNHSIEHVVTNPIKISKINEFGDNLYPTISSDKTELFFCSNRHDTVFNIYSGVYNSEITKQLLISESIKIEKNAILSSVFDDKCPYVKDNIMVFTSNRVGGFGGYDLWYSRFENNSWINPINFGDKINSENDEYRPVIFQVLGFDLMIFSSNRPQGKGGFDLYIVKIDDFHN